MHKMKWLLNSPFFIPHSIWSRGPAATTAGSHPVNDGSSPSGITLGALVQRDDARLARGKSGFDSPALHWNGLMVQRDDASSADWRSGFNSR